LETGVFSATQKDKRQVNKPEKSASALVFFGLDISLLCYLVSAANIAAEGGLENVPAG
jgi:hypothetical protein